MASCTCGGGCCRVNPELTKREPVEPETREFHLVDGTGQLEVIRVELGARHVLVLSGPALPDDFDREPFTARVVEWWAEGGAPLVLFLPTDWRGEILEVPADESLGPADSP